jgi:uncharacterized PurR-regulated membrane protein YhhQ (DUF165 family)
MATILYILSIVAANATAAWIVPMPFGAATTIGTLIFGATFTLRDRIHAQHGRQSAYAAILVAVALTALWSIATGSGWRILAASIIGLAAGEIADTEVFSRTAGGWFRRVAASNAVSVPLDTVIFNVIAFGGVWSWLLLLSVTVGDVVTKWTIGALAALWHPQH